MKKKKNEEKKNETQTKNSKKNLKAYNQIKVTVQEKTCGMTL